MRDKPRPFAFFIYMYIYILYIYYGMLAPPPPPARRRASSIGAQLLDVVGECVLKVCCSSLRDVLDVAGCELCEVR